MKRYLLWDDRMNRMRFFVCKIGLYAVTFLISFGINYPLTQTGPLDSFSSPFLTAGIMLVSLAGALFITYLDICWTIQRFHDHGKPGIYFLWLLVPMVNIYWHIVLLFSRGIDGPNEYGADPLTHGYGPLEELEA